MFETCVLLNNNFCEKLFSLFESQTAFYESFKGTAFIISDFNLLSRELDNITFNELY